MSYMRALAAATMTKPKEGQKTIGGHTARVSGARFLAGLGLELSLIQLLARWCSSVVLEYVRDAPLIALTSTTRGKLTLATERGSQSIVQSWRHDDIKQHVQALERAIDEIKGSDKHIEAVKVSGMEVHADAVPVKRSFKSIDDLVGIRSRKYKRVHLADPTPGLDCPPSSWITLGCAWRFGFADHDRVLPSSADARSRCKRCWRSVQVVGTGSSSPSSSSESAE